jgi:hypothetical protein
VFNLPRAAWSTLVLEKEISRDLPRKVQEEAGGESGIDIFLISTD